MLESIPTAPAHDLPTPAARPNEDELHRRLLVAAYVGVLHILYPDHPDASAVRATLQPVRPGARNPHTQV